MKTKDKVKAYDKKMEKVLFWTVYANCPKNKKRKGAERRQVRAWRKISDSVNSRNIYQVLIGRVSISKEV